MLRTIMVKYFSGASPQTLLLILLPTAILALEPSVICILLNPRYIGAGVGRISMFFCFFSKIVSASYENTSPKFLFHIYKDSCILIW